MEELKIILSALEKLVAMFGPTLTTVGVIAFVYFRYLKKGGILLVTHNQNGNGKSKKESILPPVCEARLKFCEEKFDNIKERLDSGDRCFEEQTKIINATHTNVAILLERTEHLKGAKL